MALAVPFPAMLVDPLDGSGVTPNSFGGIIPSLSLTGNDPVTTGFPAPSGDGTTECLVLATPGTQNFGLHATISSSERSEVGLLVRNTGYSGYLLDVNFNTGYFNLIKVTGGVGANMMVATEPWLTPTGTYDMNFSVNGNQLVGRLIDDSNPSNVAWLTTYDSSYQSGNFGMVFGGALFCCNGSIVLWFGERADSGHLEQSRLRVADCRPRAGHGCPVGRRCVGLAGLGWPAAPPLLTH